METPDIKIIARSEEVLDPSLSMIECIGKMARLCYKAEPKEGEDVNAVNERIIKRCISEGHESILEHGAISLFINPGETEDSKKLSSMFCQNAVSLLGMWNYGSTDASDKYLYPFVDPEIYGKWVAKLHPSEEDAKDIPMMNVILGDIRAWRLVVREKMMVGLSHDNGYLFLLTLRVLKELYSVNNILFQDVMDEFNTKLCNEQFFKAIEKSRIGQGILSQFEPKTCTVDAIVDKFFTDVKSVFAAEATQSAKVSVIITTERATTHQLVRHRKDVAYSQESQRYVNYDKKGYGVIGLTVDPKFGDRGFVIDPTNGLVAQESEPYKVWFKAIQNAFSSYQELLALNLPPESARGVLPNDTATRIGVTWLRPNSFMNVAFWRLDGHAQYSIRSMVARILLQMVEMNHPFMTNIPFKLAMHWGEVMKSQNLLNDTKRIDAFIANRQAMQQAIEDYIRSRQEAAMAEEKKEEKAAPEQA